MQVHEGIASDLRPLGGLLRCHVCQSEEPRGDVAGHLASGWPKCCGQTMEWLTARQLAEGGNR